jgi:hypothetical protein
MNHMLLNYISFWEQTAVQTQQHFLFLYSTCTFLQKIDHATILIVAGIVNITAGAAMSSSITVKINP